MEKEIKDFQVWLKEQGYYRQNVNGAWMLNGVFISGKELSDKLNEYKSILKLKEL
jgi:hypothetical protein